MATTTDTLIFELKVKDDATKVFDAWEKRLANMAKEAEKAFKDIKFDLPDVSNFGSGILSSLTGVVGKASSLLLSGFKGIFDGIVGLAKTAFALVSDAISETIDVAKEGIQVFGEFETGMKEIEKAAGGTEEELKGLGDALRDAVIFDLKGTSTVEQLQEIAAMSAKFGVATKDLDTFSVSVAKMADMWGLTVSKTAESAAKLQSQYKLSASQIENIGSVVDGVADSFATSEAFLLNFIQRVSGVAAATNQSIGDMAGLAGVIAVETGMAAEASSSAFQRIMNLMLGNYQTFAQKLGQSSEEMKRLVETDGRAAFSMLIEYLTRIQETGGPTAVIEAMKDLNIAGTNNERMLLGLIGKADLLNSAQEKANIFFQEGTRITENFARSIESQEAGFLQWDAVIKEVYRSIGEVLSPAVQAFQGILQNNVIPAVMSFVDWLRNSAEATKFFGADLPAAVEELGRYFDDLLQKAIEIAKNIDWSEVLDNVVVIVKQVWELFKGLTVTAKEFFQSLASGDSSFVQSLPGIFESVKSAVAGALPVVQSVVEFLGGIGSTLQELSPLVELFGKAWDSIKVAIEAARTVTEPMFQFIVDMIESINVMLTQDFVEGAKMAFTAFYDAFKNTLSMLLDLAKTIFSEIGGYIKDQIGNAVDWVLNKLSGAKDATKETVAAAQNATDALSELSPVPLEDVGQAAQEAAKDVAGLKEATKQANEAMNEYGDEAVYNSVLPDIRENINQNISAMSQLGSATGQVMQTMGNSAKQVGNEIKSLSDLMANTFEGTTAKLMPIGTVDTATAFFGGIQDRLRSANTEAQSLRNTMSSIGSIPMPQMPIAQPIVQPIQREPVTFRPPTQPETTTVRKQGAVQQNPERPQFGGQTVNINFQGQNIVDESSKNRFARQINQQIQGISGRSVNVG